MTQKRQRIVIFISGGGSNMLRLLNACSEPDFPAEVVGVFSDQAGAAGLGKAHAAGIATKVLERHAFDSRQAHEHAILQWLDGLKPDWIFLAGYMRLLSGNFVAHYDGRIINIHPSLLPLFPGLHTHQRALDAGMKIAGCTVHHVTAGMDEGAIIAQAAVPVLPDDTAARLAERVLTAEHQLYPLVLRRLTGASNDQDTDILTCSAPMILSFG
jgi:phosphoribosylglycinamide formyltransferase 1